MRKGKKERKNLVSQSFTHSSIIPPTQPFHLLILIHQFSLTHLQKVVFLIHSSILPHLTYQFSHLTTVTHFLLQPLHPPTLHPSVISHPHIVSHLSHPSLLPLPTPFIISPSLPTVNHLPHSLLHPPISQSSVISHPHTINHFPHTLLYPLPLQA